MKIRLIWQQSLRLLLIATICLIVFVIQPAALANPIIAQGNLITNVIERIQSLIRSHSTSRSNAPTGRTRGGAGRGPLCPFIEVPLRAIVPVSQDVKTGTSAAEVVLGTTIEERPTFWFYVPYSAAKGLDTAKFVLLDADQNLVSQPILVSLSGTPGIVSFHLPEAYSLEVDKLYNWYFSIVCDAAKPSRNPGVRGWVQRIAANPELTADLDRVAPLERYIAYAENGVWFEMVTDLAENLDRNPTNATLQADWTALLEELDLAALQDSPIADCCTLKD